MSSKYRRCAVSVSLRGSPFPRLIGPHLPQRRMYTSRFLLNGRGLVKRFEGMKPMALFCCLSGGACVIIVLGYLSKIGLRMDLPLYSPCIVPFTFLWLQLRRLRCADDLSSRFVAIGQYAYMAVIVVWSGVVGPPEM